MGSFVSGRAAGDCQVGEKPNNRRGKLATLVHPHQLKEEVGSQLQPLIVMPLFLWGNKRGPEFGSREEHVAAVPSGSPPLSLRLSPGSPENKSGIHLSTASLGSSGPKSERLGCLLCIRG